MFDYNVDRTICFLIEDPNMKNISNSPKFQSSKATASSKFQSVLSGRRWLWE